MTREEELRQELKTKRPVVVTCPVCGDQAYFFMDERSPFPDPWYVDMAHDHEEDVFDVVPIWVVAVHRHAKGTRYTPGAKGVREIRARTKRLAVAKKREAKEAKIDKKNRSMESIWNPKEV